MYITLSFYDFQNAFERCGRAEQFPNTLLELFNYLEQLEDETGEPIELDVIALCCEYRESTIEDVASNYSVDAENVVDYLERHTSLIYSDEFIVLFQEF